MTLLPEIPNKSQGERFARLSAIVRGMAQKMRPADEDMLQIGLAKLWELIAGGEDREDRYLIAAARNAMINRINYQRSREKEQTVKDLIGLYTDEDYRRCESQSESLGVDIEDLLSILPANWAKAFRLHVFHEYTIQEIADMLHRDFSVVRVWIRKTKEFLRKEME